MVLAGRDLLGAAQTGTGKTAGFTLPLLQRLSLKASSSHSPARHPVRALVVTPTRELALQVEESVRTYGKHVALKSTVVYGGVGMQPQVDALRRGVDIVVATPGRLLDHVQQKTIDLRQVEILVLDEADRMLDMGFIHDIRRILALLPAQRQNLLFSATFPEEIRKLASSFMKDAQTVEVARRNTPAELVAQVAHPVDAVRKRELLAHLVKANDWRQVLLFARTKHGASRLARQLEKDGLTTSAIHGDKTQVARLEALAKFKEGKLQVLVATDVAARGLDIDDLPLVVNYELPHVPEDYIHRIGRTGRAGASGEAISFVAPEEEKYLGEIERLLKKKVAVLNADGFDADAVVRERPPRGTREAGTATRGRAANGDARRAVRAESEARRAPRGEGEARVRRPASGKSSGEPATHWDTRRAEREAAYAKNPDQPIANRAPSAHDAAHPHPRAHMHAAHRRHKPVPMLLQKRKEPQTEEA